MKQKSAIVKLIEHWSSTFNLPVNTEEKFPAKERIDLALKLIREELAETEEAIDNKNFLETKDGLGDLLWVVIRAMMELGIDPDETIEAIFISNMSKADDNEEDAGVTYNYYKEKGIITYCKVVNNLFITYNVSDHKVLKSHKFQKPNL